MMKKNIHSLLKSFKKSGCAVLVGPCLTKRESLLIKEDLLLSVDGGADALVALTSLKPDSQRFVSVGDGDSSSLEMDQLLPTKKDYSDLSYALELLPQEVSKVDLYGFLGGRLDHQMINFGEVRHFLAKRELQTIVNLSNQIQALGPGAWTLEHFGPFSLMSLDNQTLSLKGQIEYPLEKGSQLRTLSSLGLSNHANGEFEISCHYPLFIYGNGIKIKPKS